MKTLFTFCRLNIELLVGFLASMQRSKHVKAKDSYKDKNFKAKSYKIKKNICKQKSDQV